MKIETLNESNWQELGSVAEGTKPNPAVTMAIVARNDGGEIVGRMFIMCPFHLEGTWVRDDYRGSTALGRMWQMARRRLLSAGVKSVLAYIPNGHRLEDYAKRLGYKKLNISVWQKSVR
ncbi:MAG: hypothetical protein ACRD3D_01025 [Terriglobia bacterium]